MAAYGREWSHRRGSLGGPGQRGRERSGYGREFQGEGPRRHAQRRYRTFGPESGFEEGVGYGANVGYGMEMEYGPEEELGGGVRYRPLRRQGVGREFGAERGYGTQRGYGAQRGYAAHRGYRTQRGYPTRPESETERGYYGGEYGFWSDYGERQFPEYGYDYEFGGRAWPYRRSYRGAGRFEGRGEPSGFRRARGGAPLSRVGGEQGHLYGREFARHGRQGQGRFSQSRFRGAGGYAEEEFGPEFGRRGEPRYGHTPADRWPQTGHDVDNLDREELEMNDGDIREAVLENLFQDSWINPERIDIDVDGGVVTLRGEVRDFMEARYAWDDAWESPGVRGVINNLTVRADMPQEGMELPQTAGSSKGFGERGRR